MRRELRWMNAVLTVGVVASAGAARAQETQEAPGPVMIQDVGMAGVQEGPGPVTIQGGVVGEGDVYFADHIELLGFGGGPHGGKVVKGAPFSAVAVSETTQTLADGDHINREPQTNLFLYSPGRVRKDVPLPPIGPLAASTRPHPLTQITP